MRHQRLVYAIAALVIAAGVAATVWWISRPSYNEIVKGCQKALSASSTKTHRPAACKGVTQDDYDTLLVAWTLKHAIDDMPKDQKDTLDYYDDGSINGSVG